jgi:hypothetical protein
MRLRSIVAVLVPAWLATVAYLLARHHGDTAAAASTLGGGGVGAAARSGSPAGSLKHQVLTRAAEDARLAEELMAHVMRDATLDRAPLRVPEPQPKLQPHVHGFKPISRRRAELEPPVATEPSPPPVPPAALSPPRKHTKDTAKKAAPAKAVEPLPAEVAAPAAAGAAAAALAEVARPSPTPLDPALPRTPLDASAEPNFSRARVEDALAAGVASSSALGPQPPSCTRVLLDDGFGAVPNTYVLAAAPLLLRVVAGELCAAKATCQAASACAGFVWWAALQEAQLLRRLPPKDLWKTHGAGAVASAARRRRRLLVGHVPNRGHAPAGLGAGSSSGGSGSSSIGSIRSEAPPARRKAKSAVEVKKEAKDAAQALASNLQKSQVGLGPVLYAKLAWGDTLTQLLATYDKRCRKDTKRQESSSRRAQHTGLSLLRLLFVLLLFLFSASNVFLFPSPICLSGT